LHIFCQGSTRHVLSRAKEMTSVRGTVAGAAEGKRKYLNVLQRERKFPRNKKSMVLDNPKRGK